jgi:hypothetical protein
MALPATITTAAEFPDHRNEPIGPYEYGGNLCTVLADKTNNRLRVYKSTDGGQTWAEQDSGTTVSFFGSVPNYKTYTTQAIGSLLYTWYLTGGTGSTLEHRAFDMSTNTWGISLWTLTLATAITSAGSGSTLRAPIMATRRGDGSSVIVVNGAAETLMGTTYTRAKLYTVTSAGTASGPFDVIGSTNSPLSNALPGTQGHIDVRAILLDSSDRAYIFLTDTATSPIPIKTRVLTSSNTFTAAAISITGATVPSGSAYTAGLPCRYTPAGGVESIALPFLFSTGNWLYVCQAPAAGADVAANWTSVQASNTVIADVQNGNNLVLSDGGTKRWVWWQRTSTGDIYYTNDAGMGIWTPETLWKSTGSVLIQGISAALITGAIGIIYNEHVGTTNTPKYDRLLVFLQ